jgi:hypothetical protein
MSLDTVNAGEVDNLGATVPLIVGPTGVVSWSAGSSNPRMLMVGVLERGES